MTAKQDAQLLTDWIRWGVDDLLDEQPEAVRERVEKVIETMRRYPTK